MKIGNSVSTKLRTRTGVSVVIVVLLIAVLVMAAVIAIPYVRAAGEQTALVLDDEQEDAAVQAGRLLWASKASQFIGIYDPDAKQILEVGDEGDTERRHYQIPAYGLSVEHKDMVIVVSADDGGADIRTFWTTPAGVTDIMEKERMRKGLD